MKILLKEDVEKLGVAGDVVTVADGYARNYLIPKNLALKATPGQVKQVDVIRRQAQRKRDRLAAEMAALTEKLDGLQFTFEANASEKGRLYGSITPDTIIEAVQAKIGEELDRRKLETDPLRQIGVHTIAVRLGAEYVPEITVIVHREGEDPETYLAVEEEEAPETEEAPAVEPEPKAEREPEVEPEAETEPEPETEPKAETEPELEPEAE